MTPTPGPTRPAPIHSAPEEAAERQRQSADPHHPSGADGFLEPGRRCRQRRRQCDIFRRGGFGGSRRGSFQIEAGRRRFGRHFRRRRRQGPLKLLQRRKRWRQCPLPQPPLRAPPRAGATLAAWLNALSARTNATMAITNGRKKSSGEFRFRSPASMIAGVSLPRTRCGAGCRLSDENCAQNKTWYARPLTRHCRGPSQSIRCRLAPQKFK